MIGLSEGFSRVAVTWKRFNGIYLSVQKASIFDSSEMLFLLVFKYLLGSSCYQVLFNFGAGGSRRVAFITELKEKQ